MDPQRLDVLLHKYGQQQCNSEELAELEVWYASLGKDMPPPGFDADTEHRMRETIWQQVEAARKPARIVRLPVWARAAIWLLPLAGIGGWLYFQQKPHAAAGDLAATPAAGKVITTQYGETRQFTLPDSTRVWLNAGSELRYENNGEQRSVTLRGEAYFDVAKDASRPFLIETGKMNIRVLGTAFNVKAYPDDNTSEASLIRGSIEVTLAADPSRRFMLRPNEKIVLPNRTDADTTREETLRTLYREGYTLSSVSVSPDDQQIAETAWTNNRLMFVNEDFADIASELERKFSVRIHFPDQDTRALRFTATFENENISQTLEALQYTSTTPFRFNIENNQVYITR
ncbi:FecR family protein [Chitinophaga lutea]